MPVAKSSPIGKLISLIETTPTTLAELDEAKVLEKLAEKLATVEIGDVTSEDDIKAFLVVTAAIKSTLGKLTPNRQKKAKSWKEKTDAAEKKLADIKQKRDQALAPMKDVEAQLKRINEEARNRVAEYATNAVNDLEDEYGELSAAEKALADPITSAVIEADGATLSFRDHFRVEVEDLNEVPDQFLDFVFNDGEVRDWLENCLGTEHFVHNCQKDGKIAIKIDPEGVPENLFIPDTVLESKIIAAGGCDGVRLVPTKIPVVKT